MKLYCAKCEKIFPAGENEDPAHCPECGAAIPVPEVFPGPGAVIGDFLIEKLLSKGGMGQVFQARQLSLDRPVALKVLQGEYTHDREYVAGLIREARAAAKINHPNVVQAYAVGQDDGIFYFAMELVRGDTMKTVLKREGVIPFAQAAKVICDVAKALDVAWRERKLVHQDIKPDNIMLDTTSGMAKLADLGLAKTGGMEMPDDDSDEVFGTPQYISPEQLTGVPTDVRSDIYSLGATFFQFVTGRFPYVAASAEELAHLHDAGNLEPPKSVNPQVPEALNRIILKMMARRPEDRYQVPAQLIEDLNAYLRQAGKEAEPAAASRKRLQTPAPVAPAAPVAAAPAEPVERRRGRKIVIIGSAVVLLLVAVALGIVGTKAGWMPESIRANVRRVLAKRSKPSAAPVAAADRKSPKPPAAVVPTPPEPQPDIRPEYQRLVAGFSTGTLDCAKVDSAWRRLSTPRSADEAKLLAPLMRRFAVADEAARCAAGREALRERHLRAVAAERRAQAQAREERMRQQRESERKQREIERLGREEARRQQLRLDGIRRETAVNLRRCALALLAAAGSGNVAGFDEALQRAERYRDSLFPTTEEETRQKRDFSNVLSAMRGELAVAKQRFARLEAVNIKDPVTFRIGRTRKRLVIVSIRPGSMICRDDDDQDMPIDLDGLEARSRTALLSALRDLRMADLEFYLYALVNNTKLPKAGLAPAGFWRNCYKLMAPAAD